MFGQVIPRSFLWFVSLCAVLIIGIISCGGDDNGADNGADDNEWGGTWSLETFDGESFKQALDEEGLNVSIVTNNWTFNSDGTIEVEVAVKLEATEGGSEISVNISTKPTGTYSLSGSNYTLTITEEGEVTGLLTVLFGGTDFEGTAEDTGTWSRKGNTLTLNSDDGTVIVLKKK